MVVRWVGRGERVGGRNLLVDKMQNRIVDGRLDN